MRAHTWPVELAEERCCSRLTSLYGKCPLACAQLNHRHVIVHVHIPGSLQLAQQLLAPRAAHEDAQLHPLRRPTLLQAFARQISENGHFQEIE